VPRGAIGAQRPNIITDGFGTLNQSLSALDQNDFDGLTELLTEKFAF